MIHSHVFKLKRVALCKSLGKYHLYVSDGFKKIYTEETLPDEIKISITMILARDSSGKEVKTDTDMDIYHLFSPTKDSELAEIGWQASHSWFVIILSNESLTKFIRE